MREPCLAVKFEADHFVLTLSSTIVQNKSEHLGGTFNLPTGFTQGNIYYVSEKWRKTCKSINTIFTLINLVSRRIRLQRKMSKPLIHWRNFFKHQVTKTLALCFWSKQTCQLTTWSLSLHQFHYVTKNASCLLLSNVHRINELIFCILSWGNLVVILHLISHHFY